MKKNIYSILLFTFSQLHAQSPIVFNSVNDYTIPAGTNPEALVSADFNNDGFIDILTSAGYFGDSLSLLLNDGTGGFNAPVIFTVGEHCSVIITDDFNGDGNADIVVNDFWNNVVHVCIGSGTGTFGVPLTYNVGDRPLAIVSGDFNSDGFEDIVTVNSYSNDISLLTGLGNGSFNAAVNTGIGSNTDVLVKGNFNNDSFPDLITNGSNGTIILSNDGNGNFTIINTVAVDGFFLVSDLNNDGLDDLITLYNTGLLSQDGTANVLLGNGNNTFSFVNNYNIRPFKDGVIRDVNDDNIPDLLCLSQFNMVQVFTGNGNGTINFTGNYATGAMPLQLAVADFDADGNEDIATTDWGSNDVAILSGNGDATFDSYTYNFPCGIYGNGTAFNDFNEDGNNDAIVSRGYDYSSEHDTSFLFAGNGDGTFGSAVAFFPNKSFATVTTDFNMDGHADVAFASGSEIYLYTGLGNGAFNAPLQTEATGKEILAGYLNSDLIPDVVVWDEYSIHILLGNGDGTFNASAIYPNCGVKSVAINDFNNDGFNDLAIGDEDANYYDYCFPTALRIKYGDGTGTFGNDMVVYETDGFTSLVTGDFNNDNIADVAYKTYWTYDVKVRLGNGSGFSTPTILYNYPYNPDQLVLSDFNHDGNMDIAGVESYTDRVYIYQNDGMGNFTLSEKYSVGSFPPSIACADVNGDSYPEIITPNLWSATFTVLMNNSGFPTDVPLLNNKSAVNLEILPNPFSREAIVQFFLLENAAVTIDLFDLQGRKIKTIAEGDFEAGSHNLLIQRGDLGAGIYFLQWQAGSEMNIRKLVVQ